MPMPGSGSYPVLLWIGKPNVHMGKWGIKIGIGILGMGLGIWEVGPYIRIGSWKWEMNPRPNVHGAW